MRGQGGFVRREKEHGDVKGAWIAPESVKAFAETHLWSDGFSRDSGLKGAGGRESTACSVSARGQKERRREGKEGRKDVVSPRV